MQHYFFCENDGHCDGNPKKPDRTHYGQWFPFLYSEKGTG